jgi:hypothetical protein
VVLRHPYVDDFLVHDGMHAGDARRARAPEALDVVIVDEVPAFAPGMTRWIGPLALAGMGILFHSLAFLVLWTGLAGARTGAAKTT